MVGFSRGVEPGMEIIGNLLNVLDYNGSLHHAVNSPLDVPGSHGCICMKIGCLTHGMNAGIGAA